MPENKCAHPGYIIKNGELVCEVCGEPSPVARLDEGVIVRIDKIITCPHCGGKLTEKGNPVEGKMISKPEDKMVKKETVSNKSAIKR